MTAHTILNGNTVEPHLMDTWIPGFLVPGPLIPGPLVPDLWVLRFIDPWVLCLECHIYAIYYAFIHQIMWGEVLYSAIHC